MRLSPLLLSLVAVAFPPVLAAQVELTPFVGKIVPQGYFGRASSPSAPGLVQELRSRITEGSQVGARLAAWPSRWLGAELSVAVAGHERRVQARGVELEHGFVTNWRTENEVHVRSLTTRLRATTRLTPRGGPVTLLAGAGVVHGRWGENPVGGDSEGGTGLTLGGGVGVRIAERKALRVDVEDGRYTFGETERIRHHDVSIAIGLSFTLGR